MVRNNNILYLELVPPGTEPVSSRLPGADFPSRSRRLLNVKVPQRPRHGQAGLQVCHRLARTAPVPNGKGRKGTACELNNLVPELPLRPELEGLREVGRVVQKAVWADSDYRAWRDDEAVDDEWLLSRLRG